MGVLLLIIAALALAGGKSGGGVQTMDVVGELPSVGPPDPPTTGGEEPPEVQLGEPCPNLGQFGYYNSLGEAAKNGLVCSPSLGAWKRPAIGDVVMVKVGDGTKAIPDWTNVSPYAVVWKRRLRRRPSVSGASALYAGMIGYPVNLPSVALYSKVRGRYGFGKSVSDGQDFMEFLLGVAQGR